MRANQAMNPVFFDSLSVSICPQSIGTMVRADTSEQSRANAITYASCLNMTPAMPFMKTMGRKTATVVSVLEMRALVTSLAPCLAASLRGMPPSCSRTVFSSTTMELSTSMPTPSARPPSVMMFSVNPQK